MPRRASGSSSAMITRILSITSSPQREEYGRGRAVALGVDDLKSSCFAKERGEPRARIGETNSGVRHWVVSRSVVLDA